MENKVLYKANRYQDIREMIHHSTTSYPKEDAFIIKQKEGNEVNYTHITYEHLEQDLNALGTALMDIGLKGKRIAIIGKNRYEWALTYIATLNGVGITVPLDKGLPEHEIEYLLKRSKANAIVFESSYLESIQKIKESNHTEVTEYICMDMINEEDFQTIPKLLKKGYALLKKGNQQYVTAKIDNKAIASIVFTSGTTSLAKAVMLSHDNIVSNIYDMNLVEDFRSTDVNMAFLPFHHMFGSTGLLIFLENGATNVFCDGLRHIQENLVEYKVSVFVGVPLLVEAMYKKIMQQVEKQGKTKLIQNATQISNFLLKFKIDIRRKLFKEIIHNLGGALRIIISGASALDKHVAKGFNDFGILTIQGYGLTETSPVLCAENEKAIRYGSVGLPMHSVKVKIEHPNEDGIGELVVKGPNVMLGYYEDEKATKEVLKDGWFSTGDLGYIDKDGFVFITGRKKNVIVLKNGKNVYPEELELLINNLPYVAESMVFGMAKEDDFIVSAKIVYNKEYMDGKYPNATSQEIRDMIWKDIKSINKTLTSYKYIKNIIVTDKEMIKTTTAKVKRFEEIKKFQ